MSQAGAMRRPKSAQSKSTATRSGANSNGAKQPRPWSHGQFYWNELRTRDAERAKKFYARTVGWSFEQSSTPDGHAYWIAMAEGRPVAGLFHLTSPRFDGVPESWMSFLAVDGVDARVAKALDAGAKLAMPIFDVPGVGRIAMLLEPGGAGVGWITPVGQQDKAGGAK
jgi:predicted enzyme related to lactoylglutathione lyase